MPVTTIGYVNHNSIMRLENGDVETLAEILHDDFVFSPHVGGITMGKSDIIGFAGSETVNCENDESYSKMMKWVSHTQSCTFPTVQHQRQ